MKTKITQNSKFNIINDSRGVALEILRSYNVQFEIKDNKIFLKQELSLKAKGELSFYQLLIK